jgi:hypothetical protein
MNFTKTPLESAADVIKDLIKHQYPHDLAQVRSRIVEDYDNEEEAKEELDCYCTYDYFKKELDTYWESRNAGEKWLVDNGFTPTLRKITIEESPRK